MKSTETGRFIKEVEKFVKKEVLDGVLDADRNRDPGWVKSIWKKSLALDLPVLAVPQDHGGAGEDVETLAQCARALAFACPGLASAYANHWAACLAATGLNKEGQSEIFSRITGPDSTAILGMWFADPLEENFPQLVQKGKTPSLSGSIETAPGALLAEWFTVETKDEEGKPALACFFRNNEGVKFGEDTWLPGLCATPFAPVGLDQVEAQPGCARGKAAEKAMRAARRAWYACLTACCVGLMQAVHSQALEYAKGRYQFGKMIIQHSEIQRMLGAMERDIQAGRAGFLAAATDEDFDPALAKASCADAALNAASDGVQIMGGYGYMHEYGMEKRMRDAKTLQLLGGSTPYLLVERAEKKGLSPIREAGVTSL